jgi:hypothetical protein
MVGRKARGILTEGSSLNSYDGSSVEESIVYLFCAYLSHLFRCCGC